MDGVSLLQSLAQNAALRSAAFIVALAVCVAVATRFIRRAMRSHIADDDLRYRASKFVGVFGYAVAALLLLTEVAGRFSGLTVALGAASAGIAFALQEVIASFAGWLAIALGGFYKVGDRVQLGGIKGDVIDIGFVRTTVMEMGSWVDGDLYNGRIVRVANSFVFKEPVYNYSGDFPFVWDEIVLPVKYGSDYGAARTMLSEVALEVVGEQTESARREWKELVRSYRIEDARVDPLVTLVANDNWVAITLRYVVHHRARRLTKDALFTRILERVESSGGRVAFASTTIQLVDLPELTIRRAPEAGTRKDPA